MSTTPRFPAGEISHTDRPDIEPSYTVDRYLISYDDPTLYLRIGVAGNDLVYESCWSQDTDPGELEELVAQLDGQYHTESWQDGETPRTSI